ncbi:MAG TPA: hypothetical protein VFT29_15850 [Gemmatimonadaceae bacterium]|nr:hypothetical protein [Gemmatimonadaceae bacterium]
MRIALIAGLMWLMGSIGGTVGATVAHALGHGVGRGGVLFGGFACAALGVVAGAYFGVRIGLLQPSQRLWAIVGGLLGLVFACLVSLSTLMSLTGPILSTLLIALGAGLGAVMGHSAHETLTSAGEGR